MIDFNERKQQADDLRNNVRDIAAEALRTAKPQKNNGDEERFDELEKPGFGSFSKALKHDPHGFVEKNSFQSLLRAIHEGTQSAFECVELGGLVPNPDRRLLANPLNAYSFQLIGDDSHSSRMAPAPKFGSRNTAVDMVERYWMALCRDVPFDRYGVSPIIKTACDDLNKLGFEQEFGFKVTPQTIFRGPYRGCFIGPHVSQFLLQDYVFGNQPILQLQRYPRPGLDYLTDLESWKRVNNGDIDPSGTDILDGTRYITTLRDAGQWVHIDLPYQSGFWSTLILLGLGKNLASANPYSPLAEENRRITTAGAFGSLGDPDLTIHVGLAAVYALKHAWFQKWQVHRRLRPEVYGHRLELARLAKNDPSFPEKFDFCRFFDEGASVWTDETSVLDYIEDYNEAQNIAQKRGDGSGTHLLPIAFPEGSPTHPAYPGGHSCFIAAAATLAKAFFADGEIANPKVPAEGGQRLVDYVGGSPLTIHGELNKLVANVTLFRDGAGMHWRTDGTAYGAGVVPDSPEKQLFPTGGNLVGESLAISILRDLKGTYREEVGTFSFEGLSGNLIEV
ncbi:MAG: phosphatidic acid phosphatase [Cyanobacteria bacterium P01_H01_bin.15]